MKTSRTWLFRSAKLLSISCALIGVFMGRACVAGGVDCVVVTSGIDPSLADTAVWAYETRGYGQVFYAADTLIRAITVWRPAQPRNYLPYRIFLRGVDSTGRPDELERILNGPVVENPNDDGVNPAPYRFVFEPPVVLARRGLCFFDVMIADCFGIVNLIANTANVYTYGQAWFTYGNWCEGPGMPEMRPVDLCFEVEYCRVGATAVRRRTFGELKTIYR